MATDLALPDELLDVPHKDGPQSELDYRASWVQTRLKFVGAINKQARCGSPTASDFALRAFCEVANPSRWRKPRQWFGVDPENETTR